MKSVLAAVSIACALVVEVDAHAQLEPSSRVCQELRVLDSAFLDFDTQDINAQRDEVEDAARAVSSALDGVAPYVRPMSPAAFDQLRQTHAAVEGAIREVPEEATPAELVDDIARAKDDDRFAYQNFRGNIVCPAPPARL